MTMRPRLLPAPATGRVRSVLSIGSNLGDRLEMLQGAVDTLHDTPGIDVIAVSPVYETEPVGGPPDQPTYLNAVVVIDTMLSARTLLERCQAIEEAYGRERTEERWGPRTLDIDLITHAGEISAEPGLTLPHPRARERAFVLVPWAAVDPDAELPGVGPVADIPVPNGSKVVCRDDLALRLPEDVA